LNNGIGQVDLFMRYIAVNNNKTMYQVFKDWICSIFYHRESLTMALMDALNVPKIHCISSKDMYVRDCYIG